MTYLPFLWYPEEHIFLKPTTTKDFAQRVGHRFAYDYDAGLISPSTRACATSPPVLPRRSRS